MRGEAGILCRVGLALLIVLLAGGPRVHGQPLTPNGGPDPVCGVGCVYAAARLLGQPVAYEALLDSRYISIARGSTVADLELAAAAAGLYSRSVKNLTLPDLWSISMPTIVHVRSHVLNPEPDHFLLVVRGDSNQISLIDPSYGLSQIDPRALSTRWDGVAIVLSDAQVTWLSVARGAIVRTIGGALVLLAGAWAIHRGMDGKKISTWPVSTALALLGAATGIGVHASLVGGMLESDGPRREVEEWFTEKVLPRVERADVERALSRGDLVIDARSKDEFERSSIAGAVSLPVDWVETRRINLLPGVDQSKPLIVYCQNRHCGISKRVAQLLRLDGFRDVRLYEGGIDEWEGRDGDRRGTAK
jgi:rhodanese-related sulfurtransferase